jgi:hypothetical protein
LFIREFLIYRAPDGDPEFLQQVWLHHVGACPKLLRLIARLRLKAHVADPLTFLLDIMHRPFDDLIAPAKTNRAKSVVYPGRLVLHVFFKPCSKVALKPIQQALTVWLVPINLWISLILDVLLHGVAADARLPGDLPLGQPLLLEH